MPALWVINSTGLRLGKGESLEEILKSMSAVAEGVLTSRSAYHLAQKVGVDCPVITGIYKVIATKGYCIRGWQSSSCACNAEPGIDA
jgi:glycerol-3-phosphate dehydrogenase